MRDELMYFDRAYRQLALVLVAVFLVACAVSGYSLTLSHRRAHQHAEQTVQNLTLSLENFLRTHFGVADLILQSAAQRFRRSPDAVLSAEAFSAILGDLQQLLPNTSGVRGSDAKGDVVYGVNLPAGNRLSIATRQFFIEAQRTGTLVFGLPVKSRVSGSWVLPLARALEDSGGQFAGTVYVNTDLDRIASFFQAINVGPLGSVALFDQERRIYFRIPAVQQLHDEQEVRFSSDKTRSVIDQGLTEAVFPVVSSIDGVIRTVGIRKIGAYPLYVLVGLAHEDYLAPWWSEVRWHLAFLGLLGLVGLSLGAALRRSWRTRGRAVHDLVTKEKELESSVEALSVSEERFRMLTEGLPQMSWVIDMAEGTLYLSRQWADFTGLPLDTLTANEGWRNCVHPDDWKEMSAAWHAALAGGDKYYSHARIRRHDGAWRVFDNNALPQRNAAGAKLVWVGSSFDVTDRVEEQVELALAKTRAEAESRAKSTFLANMSHEIRTPLNAIIGLTELLLRGADNEQHLDKLNKIATAGQHLLSITCDILDLSKIEADRMVLDGVPVRVEEIVANVACLVQERAEAKHLELVRRIEGIPADLVGDPVRLQQALLNYASNAVKFTEKGSVTISALAAETTDGETVLRFEVVDTGIGVSEAAIGKLFQSFEQGDDATTRRYGGTGLGLAITKRLAELMGGEAGVASVEARGSTFWFTARLKRGKTLHGQAEAPNLRNPKEILAREFAGRRVLVVDDEPINREITKWILEGVGLRVDEAVDGDEAIRMAAKESYPLILMDMQMPRTDGLEATRHIRLLPGYAATPILAMTANAFREDRERCFAAGMSGFLSKPVQTEELYRTIARAMTEGSAHIHQPALAGSGA
jgi:PAS domain S-box-containing protein